MPVHSVPEIVHQSLKIVSVDVEFCKDRGRLVELKAFRTAGKVLASAYVHLYDPIRQRTSSSVEATVDRQAEIKEQ